VQFHNTRSLLSTAQKRYRRRPQLNNHVPVLLGAKEGLVLRSRDPLPSGEVLIKPSAVDKVRQDSIEKDQ
jgi:hypothetical protein